MALNGRAERARECLLGGLTDMAVKHGSNRRRLRKPWSGWTLHENEEVYYAVA
jgi:hypothetical protein